MSDFSGGSDVGDGLNNINDCIEGEIVSTNPMDWMFDEEMLIEEALMNDANEESVAQNERTNPRNEEPGAQNNQLVVRQSSQPQPISTMQPDTSKHFMTDMTWETKDDVKEWVIGKAKEIMCVLVQSKHVDFKYMEMVCERAGKKGESHKGKNYKYEKKTNRVYKTSSKKCKCPFRIVFKRRHEADRWRLYSIPNGRHNHDPPLSLYGHTAYARLKPHQKEKVRQMKGFTPLNILNAIRAEDKDNLSTLSTIYAAKATLKKTEWNGRLIMQQSEWLAEKLNYAMQTKVGPGNKVTNIFLAHPRMMDLAQCFYQVLFIDCTYRTNRYNMPMLNVVSHTSDKQSFTVAWCFMEKEEIEDYVWALEQVRLVYRGEQTPQVIFTDRSFAIMSVVRQVFPLAQHFLCTWHIQTNLFSNCKNQIQKIHSKKGNQRSKEEDERLSKLSKKERAEEKKKVKEKYDEEGDLWEDFCKDWDHLAHSKTEVKYYANLQKFIDDWSTDHKKVVQYCLDTWLNPWKEKFVYAWTNKYKHFKNESTSLAEQSHGRLKKNLKFNTGGVVTVQEAIHQHAEDDLRKIVKQMEISKDRFLMQYIEDKELLHGIAYQVSWWAITHMMEELLKFRANAAAGKVMKCNCTTDIWLGLPCRHKLGGYKGFIPLADIDPFWQQLSFIPKPTGLADEEFVDLEIGKYITERYRKMNCTGRQFMVANLWPAARKSLGIEEEPIKQNPPGRPSTKKSFRETVNDGKHSGRDKSLHEHVRAEYEEYEKSFIPKERGRSKTQENENMDVVEYVIGTQQSQTSGMVTIRGLKGNLCTPRDSQGRPHRVAYTLYKEYTDQLPYVILDHLISTDDVDGDGNCGYHVATEQLGHFDEAAGLNLTQIEYARTRMAAKLVEDKHLYLTMIMGGDSKEKELKFKELLSNVKWRKGSKKAGLKFWMKMPFGGQLLADTFTCVVIVFSHGFPGGSCMYVPSRTRCEPAIKKRRIVMAHVNDNHYIGLKITEECPLPRVAYGFWGEYTEDWTKQYEYGMNMWLALEEPLITMPSEEL